MFRMVSSCLCCLLCLTTVIVGLGGCPAWRGCGDEPIAIDTVSPAFGQNLRATEITLTGGCFDKTASVTLISDRAEQFLCTNVVRVDSGTLKVKTPVGIPVGVYAVRVDRGEQSFELPNAFTAVANIVVAGGLESLIWVVDVSDMNNPEELFEIQPWGDGTPQGTVLPTVNYNATRVYFGGDESESQQAIYGADLATGANRLKITSNVVPYYGSPDASPTRAKITFVGAKDAANVPDIYIVNEDGSGQEMLADHEEKLLIGGDDTDSWGLFSPVFSPDGMRIAYIRDTVCPGCTHDWYSVIMVMNVDGSGKHIAYWEPETRFYANLHWTWDNLLVWQRSDSDQSPLEIVALDMDTDAYFHITPSDATWEDFVWIAYSPLSDGLILQPASTATMAYYPLTVAAGSAAAGVRKPVNVPNPADPGSYFQHYSEMDWFGWNN